MPFLTELYIYTLKNGIGCTLHFSKVYWGSIYNNLGVISSLLPFSKTTVLNIYIDEAFKIYINLDWFLPRI